MMRAETPSRRAIRLADLIWHDLAMLLVEEVQDPRLSMVTVSGVKMNPDLTIANVFYTCTEDPARREEIAASLDKAKGYLRKHLGHRLKLRAVPELRFQRDTFLEDMIYAG